jgi:hypothetical protein
MATEVFTRGDALAVPVTFQTGAKTDGSDIRLELNSALGNVTKIILVNWRIDGLVGVPTVMKMVFSSGGSNPKINDHGNIGAGDVHLFWSGAAAAITNGNGARQIVSSHSDKIDRVSQLQFKLVDQNGAALNFTNMQLWFEFVVVGTALRERSLMEGITTMKLKH